jgi:hypothetical protein
MEITIDGIQSSAIVAGREYQRLPHFWMESVRGMPLTRGGLTLPDPDGAELQRIAKGDAATMIAGYLGGESAYWRAEVTWVRPGAAHEVEMGLVGADRALSRIPMTEAFLHETPEAILRRALAAAGVAPGRIDSPGVTLPRCAMSRENAWQTAEKLALTCSRAFGLDMSAWALWMDDAGNAHWGDFDDPGQESIPACITGENIIAHQESTQEGSLSQVETFLLFGLRHSHLFSLQDIYKGASATVRAQKARHEISGDSARSYLSYGPEREKYA